MSSEARTATDPAVSARSEARGSRGGSGPEGPEDAALLARIAAGDRAATGLFVARHKAPLFRFARALLRDEALAEDVLQEAFVSAIRGAAGFRGEGSARPWLFVIARRAALRLLPREAPLGDEGELESLGVEAGWGAPDPEALLADEQARAAVNRALGSLEPEDREILILRDAEGMTGPEAAEVLQISLAAMKSRLHRARLRLMAALRGPTGGPCAAEETDHEGP